ncbi:glucose-6-phosphate exchanger SLC37A2-like [Argiope bruennichi]|uniref:glucose-6-phosphate exchanger SLC37A2-like n=1 Tax=Argiope bruennichi TaxID=94029 RepID=UPI0024949BC1|nr:glucose-6-phosphate exchanger SLC37A2-like [Argiope bruennichi]
MFEEKVSQNLHIMSPPPHYLTSLSQKDLGIYEIGGIPFGILAIKRFLPLDKKGRTDALRPLMLVLTFVCYALFCAARRPITVVQLKILKECNASIFENSSIHTPSGNDTWCRGTVFQKDAQTFMQVLGSLFVGAYGVCMYGSGVIADYFNPRYYLTWGTLMGSFFMLVLGLGNLWKINSIEFFIMALILFGAAQSTAWPVVLSSATHWYGGKRSGFFFALWNTHYYVGSLLGILLAGINVQERWGFAFFFPAVLVVLMGVVIFLFFVVHPADIANLDRQDISKEQEEETELPPWLDTKRAIEFYEAFKVPGVLEFSGCMFFSRMISYFFLFWRPAFLLEFGVKTLAETALYSLPYIIGGIFGGLTIGILKDIFQKNALICISFLLLSIPFIAIQVMLQFQANTLALDIFLQLIVGLLVEAPYILLSTSISVDLGTHSIMRRGHRGLATIAAIIEGTGAVGATVGPLVIVELADKKNWINTVIIMTAMEVLAALCLARIAYKDYQAASMKMSLGDYWFSGVREFPG